MTEDHSASRGAPSYDADQVEAMLCAGLVGLFKLRAAAIGIIDDVVARASRINRLKARKYVHRRRASWRRADVDLVLRLYGSSGLTPATTRRLRAALHRGRGRPALDPAAAQGPWAGWIQWARMPESSPGERRRKHVKSPFWPRVAAEAYAGEYARLVALKLPSPSDTAIDNVAQVFGVSPSVVRRDMPRGTRRGAAPSSETLVDPDILVHCRHAIEHGSDGPGSTSQKVGDFR